MTAFWLLCHFALLYVVFFGPAMVLSRRLRLPRYTCSALTVLAFSLAGYVNFWLWLWWPTAGRTFVVMATAAAVLMLVASLRGDGFRIAQADIIVPFALIAAFGVLYVGLMTLDSNDPIVDLPEIKFSLPGDDHIPQGLADRLEAGTDIRVGVGDWLSSDRPPLQSGIVLLQQDFLTAAYRDEGYELLGLLCQLAWIAGLWAVSRAAGLKIRHASLVILLIGMTSFTFENSIFVWPKMLAASFALLVLSLVIGARAERRPLTRAETIVSAAAVALALLAHGGVAFTLVPLVVWVLVGSRRPGLHNALRASAVCVLLLYPWSMYQHFYDPPGDRLIRWHLAGVQAATDHRPAIKAIADEYRRAGSLHVVSNKEANLATIVPRYILTPSVWMPTTAGRGTEALFDQFLFFFDGCGLLLIGTVPLVVLLVRRGRGPDNGVLAPLTGLLFAGLIFWVLIMFGPGSTVSHQGSYANNLIAGFVLCSALVLTVEWIAWPLLAVECVQLCVTIAVADVPGHPTNAAGIVDIVLGFVLMAAIVSALLRSKIRER